MQLNVFLERRGAEVAKEASSLSIRCRLCGKSPTELFRRPLRTTAFSQFSGARISNAGMRVKTNSPPSVTPKNAPSAVLAAPIV